MLRTSRRRGSRAPAVLRMRPSPLVALVDDDASVREALPDLLRALGYRASAFASARDFLASPELRRADCALLDIAMPDISGLELQGALRARHVDVPVVFMTAHLDEFDRPGLLARGAVGCLLKPFSDAQLLSALQGALGTRP